MKVAVLGSTGLIGKNVLKLLARLPQVVRVFCPVRNIPDLKDLGILEGAFKLDFKQVDFEQDNEALRLFFYAGFTGCDAVVCCLGTISCTNCSLESISSSSPAARPMGATVNMRH